MNGANIWMINTEITVGDHFPIVGYSKTGGLLFSRKLDFSKKLIIVTIILVFLNQKHL